MTDNLTEKGKRDLKLINRALEDGDSKAYNELMKLYRDPLYFMLYEKVGDQELAKDLTIESLGKAFKKLHLYTPNYAFSTWLFKIATNNCIDFIRKKKKNVLSIDNRFENEDGDSLMIELKSSGRDPEQEAMREQKIKLMREVVTKLKPRYQKLVELRYFKELSYEEISNELDLPLGTVKAQLFRAREFLYNIMKNTRESI